MDARDHVGLADQPPKAVEVHVGRGPKDGIDDPRHPDLALDLSAGDLADLEEVSGVCVQLLGEGP
jgi:hypothetical protein